MLPGKSKAGLEGQKKSIKNLTKRKMFEVAGG
jgi:hypothetical protein